MHSDLSVGVPEDLRDRWLLWCVRGWLCLTLQMEKKARDINTPGKNSLNLSSCLVLIVY